MLTLIARRFPVRKDRRVIFDLPPVNSLEDAAKIASAVLIAVATGELTPADASEICKLIDTWVKAWLNDWND